MRDLQSLNKYNSFRPHQEETIEKILDVIENTDKKFIILEAPCGSGKSAIAYTVAKYLTEKEPEFENRNDTYILTEQKILQDQYVAEFCVNNEMANLKGRNNYLCTLNPTLTVDKAMCVALPADKVSCRDICPYYQARRKAKDHYIALLNYKYALMNFDFNGVFGKRTVAILDEAHVIEKVLMGHAEITFNQYFKKLFEKQFALLDQNIAKDVDAIIQRYFFPICQYMQKEMHLLDFNFYKSSKGMSFLEREYGYGDDISLSADRDTQVIHTFKNFLSDYCLEHLERLIKTIERVQEVILERYVGEKDIQDVSIPTSVEKIISQLSTDGISATNYFKKITTFLNDDRNQWIVDLSPKLNGIVIKPITVSGLAQKFFDQIADRVILMSATICGEQAFCENLGINKDNVEYIDVPSIFPVDKRPIFFSSAPRLNYQNMDTEFPKIIEAADSVLDSFPDSKGIVHAVSYGNVERFLTDSRHWGRILVHESNNREETIRQFMDSTDNVVLMSPSILEGLDLSGDLSRFQVFLKAPFLSLGDVQVKARKNMPDGYLWYVQKTIMALAQGTGRSFRHSEDECYTFCLDASILNLYERHKSMFPQWFAEGVDQGNKVLANSA